MNLHRSILAVPTIGITLGDPTGVGPEVMRAAVEAVVAAEGDALRVEVFLPQPMVESHGGRWATQVHIRAIAVPGPTAALHAGVPSEYANRCAFLALEAMVDAAEQGQLHAMVTGPVAKGIFDGLTPQPPGQTEYIAARLQADRFAMMLAGPKLRVVPVTTHIPLSRVSELLTTDAIVSTTIAAVGDLQGWLGIAAPKVAVCGLNPHAGEAGRLGDEEQRLIAPAVRRLREQEGLDIHGPLPADGLFFQALQGRWDLIICMYHDQALAPLKTVHFFDGWNQTCGLQVPRLSPDHGTAWDIAGRGIADAQSATAAMVLAAQIARRRS
ncbi:MAG: 4-hydroxythreonine-4-phosphate dehydrogenase PdxA [Myxococcales bacterium]|nr:4-hydroxythreonine-4-phosphate dehydrogenase PdxA [Myxococcales bacterium]